MFLSNGALKMGFIPRMDVIAVILAWTHRNGSLRSFHPADCGRHRGSEPSLSRVMTLPGNGDTFQRKLDSNNFILRAICVMFLANSNWWIIIEICGMLRVSTVCVLKVSLEDGQSLCGCGVTTPSPLQLSVTSSIFPTSQLLMSASLNPSSASWCP